MAALAELLGQDQAAALASLQGRLITDPGPLPEAQPTAAVCPLCGTATPAPAAVFLAPGEVR